MELPPDMERYLKAPYREPAPAPEVPPAQATAAEVPPETEPDHDEPPETEPEAEEKTSGPDQAAEVDDYTGPKVKTYNGKGRRHNDRQIDEILDWFLLYGQLPDYVTPRQQRDYKRHPRLEVRKLYLEQAGFFRKLHEATRNAENVL
jgi:hypothetical protein